MINLKNNIWIDSFLSLEKVREVADFYSENNIEILAYGKISEIGESLAEVFVQPVGIEKGTVVDENFTVEEDLIFGYKNYRDGFGVSEYLTAKESIKSACEKPFYLIYKK